MTLYNCKPEGSSHRITKFDNDLNVESTYLCTESTCECPAGHRHTCRHRQMLPRFLAKPGADRGQWLYDFDRSHWVRASTGEDALEDSIQFIDEASSVSEHMWETALDEVKKDKQTQMMIGDEATPITTEDLDVAQFGRVLHERPISLLELAKLLQYHNVPIRVVDEINPTTKPMRRI